MCLHSLSIVSYCVGGSTVSDDAAWSDEWVWPIDAGWVYRCLTDKGISRLGWGNLPIGWVLGMNCFTFPGVN